MDIKQMLPPSAIAAGRLLKTKASILGWGRRAEFEGRRDTLERMAAQHVPATPGAPVLVFSFRGWYPHVAWEAVLAHALRLRGVPAHVFNCGGELPICEVNFRGADPAVACRECAAYPESLMDALGLPRTWLREYIADSERHALVDAVDQLAPRDYQDFRWNGQPVGALVHDSVLWFLRKSSVETGEDHDVYRRFLIAGAHVSTAAPKILQRVQPRAVLQLNGRFFAERIFNRFVPASVPVVTYECGWRRDTLGFDRLSDAGPLDLDEAWAKWKDCPLTASEDAVLDEWISSRGAGDMQRDFYIEFRSDAADPLRQLGLDPARATAVLFTNLVWDTAVLGKDEAFPSIRDWLRLTIDEFARRADWQLVVRIHPAEQLRPSQPSVERLTDVVKSLGELPPNIRVVLPIERLSSYALMSRCQATLVYTSTTGLEAALRKKPVVVAARVYYRYRGFTIDVIDQHEFAADLRTAMSATQTGEQFTQARRFAYLLLFRYLKRIPVVRQQSGGFPQLVPEEVDALLAGRSSEFDALLDAITAGGPFV